MTVSEYKMLDHVPIGACVISRDFEVVFWNKCLEDWTDILRSQIVGNELKAHFPHFNEPKYSGRIQQVFAGGPPIIFSSQFHPHIIPTPLRNGKLRIQHTFVSAISAEGQCVTHALMAIQDVTDLTLRVQGYRKMHKQASEEITKRQQAEAKMQQQAEELTRSNAELEQFAYVASHDLQEPLRKVKNFAELLAKKYTGRLDSKADSYIAYVVDGAQRMQKLIQDLLSFSKIGRGKLELEPTNLEAVVKDIISLLELPIKSSKAEVTYDSLPSVGANSTLITQLFQNLIGNALKYRGEAAPKVHIAAEQQNGHLKISVKDNGIGIEPEFSERVFGIFQRLHTRGEYSGTGVGLAICKKIIEQHGGSIWIEPGPGEGSTFYFTLPKGNETEITKPV